MCGIAGVVDRDARELARRATAMREALRHRGPDDAGLEVWPEAGVALAHRRLSIIDLSPAGRQPMTNEDGSVWIVFNGEIYNYRALRSELEARGHVFRSRTDTEVIVHAYEAWGDAHVHRLRGMFAYAILDRRPAGRGGDRAGYRAGDRSGDPAGGRLLLVRDRIGVKPLFYYRHGGTFLFASEIKALLAYPGVDRTVDRSALFDYLTYLYVPAPKTAYARIRKLPPGHLLVLEGGALREEAYWDVPLEAPPSAASQAEAVEMVREALEEAVRLHTVSDVPVGVFLSGGMDSSTITALLARDAPQPAHTFSVDFDVAAHSEAHYARRVAQHCGTEHHERTVGVEQVRAMLPQVLRMYDEPYADGSAVPTYCVSAAAREQLKVVLSGDGGDEVFAGYNWYTAWLRRRLLDRVPLGLRRGAFAALGARWHPAWRGKGLVTDLASGPLERFARLMELFSPAEKRRLLHPDWAHAFRDYDDYWYFRQHWRPDLDPLTRLQYLDLKTYLPDDILTKVDRASMAVSLEVRPPFTDHVLVEKLFAVPAAWRAPGGEKKYLLKAAARDLLPAEILERPKKGFSAPWHAWMAAEQAWVARKLREEHAHLGVLRADVDPARSLPGAKAWAVLLLQEWLGAEQSVPV